MPSVDQKFEGDYKFTGAVDLSGASVTFPDAPAQVTATAENIVLKAVSELTIASGAITITDSHHTVDTESDGATDDLDTISGGAVGRVVLLKPASGSRTVVVRDTGGGTGNIRTPQAVSISLAEASDFVVGYHDGTNVNIFAGYTLANGHIGGPALASTASGKGASLVGIQDSASIITATTVEGALAEIAARHGALAITDPGNAGAIPVTRSGVCAMTSAGAETRTLAIPSFIGQRLVLVADTYVGDIVVTAASAVNVANNNTLTFGAVSEAIELVGVSVGGTLCWQVGWNDNVGLSTV
jgi:hypothetical protein